MEAIFIGWFILAFVIGAVAATKEKSFGLWFFLSILLSPLLAGFCLVISLMPNKSSSEGLVTKDDFEEKWSTLTKYDEGTKNAINQLEVYGNNAIDELKKVLRATNDPSRLPIIANQIANDFQIKIENKKQERAAQAAKYAQEQMKKEEEILDRTKAALITENIQYPFDDDEFKVLSAITNITVRRKLATAIMNGFKVNREIKYCLNCGETIPFRDLFCNKCNKELSVVSNERSISQRVENYLKWYNRKNIQTPTVDDDLNVGK